MDSLDFDYRLKKLYQRLCCSVIPYPINILKMVRLGIPINPVRSKTKRDIFYQTPMVNYYGIWLYCLSLWMKSTVLSYGAVILLHEVVLTMLILDEILN